MQTVDAQIINNFFSNKCSPDEIEQIKADVSDGVSIKIWENGMREFETQLLANNTHCEVPNVPKMFSEILKRINTP